MMPNARSPTTKADVLLLAKSVEGWLSDGEASALYDLAHACREGPIVEIGSWKGKSTTILALASKAGHKALVYAIDPHVGSPEHQKDGSSVWTFDEFRRNMDRVGASDVVRPLVMTSAEAARGFREKASLVWIDGAHEYEMVLIDIDSWTPHLAPGGIVAFHDTNWEGPARVVKERLYRGRDFRNIRFTESIVWAERCTRQTRGDRLRNRYARLLRALYMAGRNVPLPQGTKDALKRGFRGMQRLAQGG